jgi:L-ascorbate metabolism protein UlaG (beta-lactamase superfamily)
LEIIYHGHSCIQLVHAEHSLIIDPFISGNPHAKTQVGDIKVQYILLTHGHEDHILDAVQIAKHNDATIIAIPELATYMEWQGAKTRSMNIGGQIDLGMPGGFIVEMNQKTIYHAGDTGLFSDMKLFGEQYLIDVAFLPIGDIYTMGPNDAIHAAAWISANHIVPIHYNTFPQIQQNEEDFFDKLSKQGMKGKALKPGETLTIS